MSFVIPTKREKVDALTTDEVRDILLTYKAKSAGFDVGDICYYFYQKMMVKWNLNKRWTTIHQIKQQMTEVISLNYISQDAKTAYELAFMVFFNLHGIDYEREKMKLNGDIAG